VERDSCHQPGFPGGNSNPGAEQPAQAVDGGTRRQPYSLQTGWLSGL